MRDYYTVKINLPAGIASPAALQVILKIAYEARVRRVRFGARQQLLITVHYEEMRSFEKALRQQQITFETNTDEFPNIISSYCGEEVFRTGSWLREGEYHTLLDQFDYQPRLKINLSDSDQSFTPFFTGNLNFIASPDPHFWYLYVRPRQSNTVFQWRDLIYTNDVGRLAKLVEEALLAGDLHTADALYDEVNRKASFITQPATQQVQLPEFSLPYYEGFNRYGQRTWLGLYRQDEQFSVDFLLDLCALCLRTRVGELCITPWKSLIIKNISEEDRRAWSMMLGKHNINVRHAANELAWQTEDHSDEGTAIKQQIVRYFERYDTRTFGLCFGVQTRPKSEVFGSILIRRRALLRIGALPLLSVYDLYFTEQFNPNSRTYFLFEKGLLRSSLPVQVHRLCRQFSTQRLKIQYEQMPADPDEAPAPVLPVAPTVFQCPHCFTAYDPQFGDSRNDVAPGTPFADVPETYLCPTCDAPKQEWVSIQAVAVA
ncbi:rubredoxin [Fibrella arboris]|uniref:rubredoxin n=1 Tax=Fibrella arboris TaxID=3242486 RepID=UPI00351FE06A